VTADGVRCRAWRRRAGAELSAQFFVRIVTVRRVQGSAYYIIFSEARYSDPIQCCGVRHKSEQITPLSTSKTSNLADQRKWSIDYVQRRLSVTKTHWAQVFLEIRHVTSASNSPWQMLYELSGSSDGVLSSTKGCSSVCSRNRTFSSLCFLVVTGGDVEARGCVPDVCTPPTPLSYKAAVPGQGQRRIQIHDLPRPSRLYRTLVCFALRGCFVSDLLDISAFYHDEVLHGYTLLRCLFP
jgi:hypothetical protein